MLFGGRISPLIGGLSTKRGRELSVVYDWLLECRSGAVVLVEDLTFVYAHDPVESDYEE